MTKRILLYTDEPGMGGVAQYNHEILLGLVQRGYSPLCVQSRVDNPLIRQQQEIGVQHYWLPFDTMPEFERTLQNAEESIALFQQLQPDLILFSDGCPVSNFAAKRAAIALEIPFLIVVGFVTPDFAKNFEFCLPLLAEQYAKARSVIAVSQENLDLLHRHFRLPLDRGEVIYCGRPPVYFTPRDAAENQRLREEFGIPEEAIVCFTSARLEPIKGYQYQVEAIAQLQRSDLYFVWAGEGVLQAELTEAAQRNGDRIRLLGKRWDIANLLNIADIFVFPSKAEGMPLAVMEAMAKGIPTIATSVSGIPEELGNTGKLLPDPNLDPQGTIAQLAQTIAAWADNSQLRQAIGQAGRQRAIELFQADRMVRETLMVVGRALLPDGDYVSPGLAIVRPDAAFPHKIIGNPETCAWPYLRRTIPHNWYVDRRQPQVGFLSRDEAQILYNSALQFRGKPALEIGCWLGWSACHLALAGVELDVIDPMLGRSEFYASVDESLKAAGVRDRVNLIAGYSPEAVEALAADGRQWALIFIDGDHDAPAPLQDAIACLPFAAPDAMIVFHDLASPDVAAGLDYLKEQGWNTQVYQTMQIMGVAWRGNVEPIDHQPDPTVDWPLPAHLRQYEISGMDAMALDPMQQLLREIAALQLPPVSPVLPSLSDRHQLHNWLAQGKTAYRQDRQADAIAAFQSALTINPSSRIAHQHLSHLFWQQNDLPRSLHHHALALSGNAIADGMQGEEFQALFAAVRPFTLLSVDRLFSLYSLTKQICLDDVPGEIVECGTCRGGAAALLAAVVQRYSLRPRRVYAFDTFEGMPDPTEIDRHQGIPANETGFGVGTLKAPIAENLNLICESLGVQDLVIPVAGLFANTLPATRSSIGAIALLHANGDWYESTLDIFNTLYDQIVPDGVIQVDDYGHWEGCRQAVHEFERDRFTEFGLRSIDYTGVWFTRRDPAHPDCNYWRICWHWAQSAVQQGDRLAHSALQAVLKLMPNLVQADRLHQALNKSDLPDLTESLRLRSINWLAFPDWNQPEDELFAMLSELLHMLLTHPDRDQLTLLISTNGSDPEEADLMISSVVMELVSELEIDDEPEITLFGDLSAIEWQALLPKIARRVELPHENQSAIDQSGIDRA